MKDCLRHLLNPLHVYCRLMDLGLNSRNVHIICLKYEKIYRILL